MGKWRIFGLLERERLEQLVERAEAAGEDDESVRVADEHDLAREEVVERQARGPGTSLGACSKGSSMFRPTERAAGVARAAVGGLHDPGPAAGDDREARRQPSRAARLRPGVVGWRGRARRAEERDRRAHARRSASKPHASSPPMRSTRSASVRVDDRARSAPSSSSSCGARSGRCWWSRGTLAGVVPDSRGRAGARRCKPSPERGHVRACQRAAAPSRRPLVS